MLIYRYKLKKWLRNTKAEQSKKIDDIYSRIYDIGLVLGAVECDTGHNSYIDEYEEEDKSIIFSIRNFFNKKLHNDVDIMVYETEQLDDILEMLSDIEKELKIPTED